MGVERSGLPAPEDRIEQFHAKLFHQLFNVLGAVAELAPGVQQVLLQIPLDQPTLLLGDGECE
jgi:hypothetical protein